MWPRGDDDIIRTNLLYESWSTGALNTDMLFPTEHFLFRVGKNLLISILKHIFEEN